MKEKLWIGIGLGIVIFFLGFVAGNLIDNKDPRPLGTTK